MSPMMRRSSPPPAHWAMTPQHWPRFAPSWRRRATAVACSTWPGLPATCRPCCSGLPVNTAGRASTAPERPLRYARASSPRGVTMAKLKRKDYDELLLPLQLGLTAMARWVQLSGQRLLVLFEGRDTAGKGGAIQAISQHLNPRQCRVVALP